MLGSRLRWRLLPLGVVLVLLLGACADTDCEACVVPEPSVIATGELAFRVCLSSAPQAALAASRCSDVSLAYLEVD